MAINNTTGSFPFMEFPMAFSRQDSFPLDKTSVYGSLEAAQTYAQTSRWLTSVRCFPWWWTAPPPSTRLRTPQATWKPWAPVIWKGM